MVRWPLAGAATASAHDACTPSLPHAARRWPPQTLPLPPLPPPPPYAGHSLRGPGSRGQGALTAWQPPPRTRRSSTSRKESGCRGGDSAERVPRLATPPWRRRRLASPARMSPSPPPWRGSGSQPAVTAIKASTRHPPKPRRPRELLAGGGAGRGWLPLLRTKVVGWRRSYQRNVATRRAGGAAKSMQALP